MEKNIGTQEAHMRTIIAVVLLLIALLVVESPFLKIVLAIVAATLALTAFLRTCPVNTMLHKNTYDDVKQTSSAPIISVPAEETDTPQETSTGEKLETKEETKA